jgi:aryl-alcohol dehydrogenase-like predicted oxidoreductase
MQAIDASLKRLGTDYIDLYYVHWPDPTTPIEETLRTLNDLVQAGKVRYIGCSNFSAWQLCESLWISKVNNLESFVAVQSRYNYLDRSIESELVPCCQAYGVGIIPWAPLADGFLTGKYQRGKPTPTGSRLSITPPSMKISPFYSPVPEFVSHLTDTNYDKLETLQKFAASHGRSVGELAIAWLLSHSTVSSVIAGATNPAQISANITGIDWKLTGQEMAQLG